MIDQYKQLIPEKKKNICSLFLYIGKQNAKFANPAFSYRDGKQIPKHGVLYTGDGDLSKPTQLHHLIDHMGQDRIENIYCLQVMHHGSSYNSYPEVARLLQPEVSVFSADPAYKYHHPHADVFLQFMNNNPVLTNKKLQYAFCFSRRGLPCKKCCLCW